jgi:biotin operon repressor
MHAIKYLDRLKYINKLIKTGSTGSAKEFARKLNISESHLYRLIKELKDMGAPIEFCRHSNCYCYTEEFDLEVNHSIKLISKKEIRIISGGFFMKKPLTVFI